MMRIFARGEHQSFTAFVARAPLLLFAVSTATIFDAVMLAFFVIYGLRNGMSLQAASWALAVAIAGNALFQYPIGMLADRWSRASIMWSAAILTISLRPGAARGHRGLARVARHVGHGNDGLRDLYGVARHSW